MGIGLAGVQVCGVDGLCPGFQFHLTNKHANCVTFRKVQLVRFHFVFNGIPLLSRYSANGLYGLGLGVRVQFRSTV